MAYKKRPREDDTQANLPNIKRVKAAQHCLDNYPPTFWDSLSKVFLTARALRELDRRNNIDPLLLPLPQPQAQSQPGVGRRPFTRRAAKGLASRTAQFANGREEDYRLARRPRTRRTAEVLARRIAQYAISGEQDLSDLRGFSTLPNSTIPMGPKSSSRSSSKRSRSLHKPRSSQTSQTRQSSAQTSNAQTSNTPKSARSSAYDANFERHFMDNGVYPPYHGGTSLSSKPNNLSEIRNTITEPRASLSPSQVTSAQFERFNIKNETTSEGTVMRSVIPMITGDKDIQNEGHIPFTNFTSMTNEATVKPIPDFYDGAPLSSLHQVIKDHESLNTKIIPKNHLTAPAVPNFFLEAKAPSGGVDVARRQAMADGAYGARAMHSLQNYGLDETVYDGNAYTYSSIYHSGVLRLYAHHVTAPTAGKGPRYHMTQLRGYDLTDSPDAYREAKIALRNTRDLARQQRDDFIAQANIRAQNSDQIYGEVTGESSGYPTIGSYGHSTTRSHGHLVAASQGIDQSTFAYLPPQDDDGDGDDDEQEEESFALTAYASVEEADASHTTSFTSTTNLYESKARKKRISSHSPPEPSRRTKAQVQTQTQAPLAKNRTRSGKRKGKDKEIPQ